MSEPSHEIETSAAPWPQASALADPTSPAYAGMIEAVRDFLNKLASAKPDDAMSVELTETLNSWSQTLASVAVGEDERVCGRRLDLPGRGYLMLPGYLVSEQNGQELHGTVEFGDYFLGRNGAVHGGSIPLLFDDVFGRLINSEGRARTRTAYLHADYRSITPVNVKLSFRAWIVSEEGRKRIVRGEIRHGDTLCVEAEGLFLTLKPGQP